MSYTNFGKKEINLENKEEISESYSDGFVFVRNGIGLMEKVRSIRIDLDKFELSSENRRILRKYDHKIELVNLPYENYVWEIHKMGKDFYDTRFGKDTFSANKIKEIFTEKSNFNFVFKFTSQEKIDGYCICYWNEEGKFLHYAYPFYSLGLIDSSFGIFMMTKAIEFCKKNFMKYIYLGSAHDEKSKYKIQFKGLEWYDEKTNQWSEDENALKSRLIA